MPKKIYQIDKGVSVFPYNDANEELFQAFIKMEVGDSTFISDIPEVTVIDSVAYRACYADGKFNKKEFTVRKVVEYGTPGFRVWRHR